MSIWSSGRHHQTVNMVPGRLLVVFLFFVAISYVWGSDESLKLKPRSPKFFKDGLKSRTTNNVIVESKNESRGKPGSVGHVRYGMEKKECGQHYLQPGESVVIQSKNFPDYFPAKEVCTWTFIPTVHHSNISITCKTFQLNECYHNFVIIAAGNFNQRYCGNKQYIDASVNAECLRVYFKSKANPNQGFDCVVSAPVTISMTTTTTSTTSTSTSTPTTTTSTTPTTTTTTPTTTTPTTTTPTTTTPTTTTPTTTTSTMPTTTTPTTTTTTTPTTTTPTTTTPTCTRSYNMNPGESVVIESKNFPKKFPSYYECTWTFKATCPESKLTINCKPFKLLNCSETFLHVTGGSCNKTFCGNKKNGVMATSTTGLMKVIFMSKKETSEGFKCTVSASDSISSTTPNTPVESCQPCGTVNRATRIIGGGETEVNEYPWQVAIVYAGTNTIFCGGAVYNDLFVMTAAQCGKKIYENRRMAEVLLGAHNLTNLTLLGQLPSSVQRIAVSDVITDGSFNPPASFDHDIALLKLAKPATLNRNVKPACLPNPYKDYAGVNAIITGWGQTHEVGSVSNVLMEVEVPTLSNAACQNVYGSYITENMICTGYPSGVMDKCYGDTGGPLVVEENGRWTVIGIGSWNVGCERPGLPGGYERVSKYLFFLAMNAGGGQNNLCSNHDIEDSAALNIMIKAPTVQPVSQSTSFPFQPNYPK